MFSIVSVCPQGPRAGPWAPSHIQTCSTWISLYRDLTRHVQTPFFAMKPVLLERRVIDIRLKCLLVFMWLICHDLALRSPPRWAPRYISCHLT